MMTTSNRQPMSKKVVPKNAVLTHGQAGGLRARAFPLLMQSEAEFHDPTRFLHANGF
jgi:hypothetical protein